ncbi:MAG: hypothetical protein ACI9ZF_000949 [Bradyrhizobium sp.]|jgi:hypothetical protein
MSTRAMALGLQAGGSGEGGGSITGLWGTKIQHLGNGNCRRIGRRRGRRRADQCRKSLSRTVKSSPIVVPVIHFNNVMSPFMLVSRMSILRA